MSFRVETATRGRQVLITCEGHLDADAMAAIEHGWTSAEAAGVQAVVRLCAGATADRPVVVRLSEYPGERLEVESPFLRSWLENVRGRRA